MRPQEIIPFPDYPILGYFRQKRIDPRRLSGWRDGRKDMDRTMTLCAFIERAEATDGSDGYVAGLRSSDGEETWLKLPIPAEAVECAVLKDARFSVMLSPCGRLAFEAEGLSDEALELAGAGEPFRGLTLETLVRTCLDPMLLQGEDNLSKDLDALHGQLQRALQLVEETRNRLSGTSQS
jgi:hypothetical protein